ncbi:hypothetical protein N9N28_01505 [Rubripirellula amarantea]|nr:hypothetical protein [Rubripirellula amarantea]
MSNSKQTIVTLFGFSFLSAASYVVTSALGISLFISRVGSYSLPVVLVASALTVILVSFATRWLIARISPRLCVVMSWLIMGASSLLISLSLVKDHHSFFLLASLYVLGEVRGSLNSVYVTTFTNDSFASSSTKRPYVVVAMGGPIAGIVAGSLMSLGSTEIQGTTWIAIVAALDLATLALTRWLPRPSSFGRTPSSKSLLKLASAKVVVRERMQAVHRRPIGHAAYRYRYALAALVGVKVAVLALVGYQWKVVAGDYFVDEQRLLAYFATFYAVSDVLILLLQLSTATKLLDRFGIGLPLHAYPLLLAVLGVTALATGTPAMMIVVFTLGRGLNVLRRSFHDPGLASAYSILDPKIRRETIVVVKGMIKPFAEAVAALGLLFFSSELSASQLTFIWLVMLVPWFWFAHWVAETYDRVGTPRVGVPIEELDPS